MSIDYFNRNHRLHGLKSCLALRARQRMYQRVLRLGQLSPETRVLDVGTTPDLDLPYNNFFERWYPHTDRLTACSVEDCSHLERRFPGLTFRLIEGETLPFRDQEFDLAVSFAVLEHVGAETHQRHFLSELARVARAFIAYTPYRYFPVEMHTLLPFVHWLPTTGGTEPCGGRSDWSFGPMNGTLICYRSGHLRVYCPQAGGQSTGSCGL
jgi:hypothetical protein